MKKINEMNEKNAFQFIRHEKFYSNSIIIRKLLHIQKNRTKMVPLEM